MVVRYATSEDLFSALVEVCREEQLVESVLAIEALVAIGTRDPSAAETLIRHSIEDVEIINARIDAQLPQDEPTP